MNDKELLYLALHYSMQAYKDEIPGAAKFESKLTSATAFLIEEPRYNVLAYRGSQQPWDWVMNVTALPWRYGRAVSHAGFNLAHASLWGSIAPQLDPRKPLLITGHSAGGAAGEKTGEFVDGFKSVSLITFGKPNIYFKPCQKRDTVLGHLKTQLSVVNGSDLVALIPRYFYGPDLGQSMLYLANDGGYIYNPTSEERRADRDHTIVSDHSLEGYQRRLIEMELVK